MATKPTAQSQPAAVAPLGQGAALDAASLNTLPLSGSLAAGATTGVNVCLGSNFYVSVCSNPGGLIITPNKGSGDTYVQGTGRDYGNTFFTGLTITNPSATPVTFVVEVGFAEYIDKRLVLQVGGLTTALPVTPAKSLALGGPGAVTHFSSGLTPYPGTSNPPFKRRSIIVTNLDSFLGGSPGTGVLVIWGSNSAPLTVVLPGSPPVAIETNDQIFIGSYAGSCWGTVGEIYDNQ